MRITELGLETQQLQTQQQFYTTTLGLPLIEATSETFTIQAGLTRLTFRQTSEETLYHFAFTIPANQTIAARRWLLERVPLLNQENQDEFSSGNWNATSFYFRDAAGHILELIAHHDLQNTTSGPFGVSDLLYISEIGLVFEDVASQVKVWKAQFDLEPYRGAISEMFAAVGDIYGLFITVQNGRNWFPTNSGAVISPVDVTIDTTKGTSQNYTLYPYNIKVNRH